MALVMHWSISRSIKPEEGVIPPSNRGGALHIGVMGPPSAGSFHGVVKRPDFVAVTPWRLSLSELGCACVQCR
jgi:hypothetical protein